MQLFSQVKFLRYNIKKEIRWYLFKFMKKDLMFTNLFSETYIPNLLQSEYIPDLRDQLQVLSVTLRYAHQQPLYQFCDPADMPKHAAEFRFLKKLVLMHLPTTQVS